MGNNINDSLFERSCKVAPGGVHSPVRSFKGLGRSPIFFSRADGAHLYDTEGKKYIDYCQSFGPLLLGHRDPEVQEAVRSQLDNAWTLGAAEPYSLELAEWMINEIPFIEKLRFVSSGTEAVMSALRIARAATGKSKIVKFEGCYHGHVDSMLVKAGSGLAGTAESSSAGVSDSVASETLLLHLNDIEKAKGLLAERGDEIAALIIEPLPANNGLLVQTEEYLKELVHEFRKHNVLIIFDEVISGFRIGLQGMAGRLNIQPDLVTYGKIIGGGFPVGCYAGKAELIDLVAPLGRVYQAGTLSANPIGMVAGLATLKKAKRENVWPKLAQLTSDFATRLNQAMAAKDYPFHVLQYDSLFWLTDKTAQTPRSVSDISSEVTERYNPVFLGLLDQSIYLSPNAYEVGFVGLSHTPEILSESIDRIMEVCQSVYG